MQYQKSKNVDYRWILIFDKYKKKKQFKTAKNTTKCKNVKI